MLKISIEIGTDTSMVTVIVTVTDIATCISTPIDTGTSMAMGTVKATEACGYRKGTVLA